MRTAEVFKLGGVSEILVIRFPNDISIRKFDLEGSGLACEGIAFEGDDFVDEMLVVITQSCFDGGLCWLVEVEHGGDDVFDRKGKYG